jgi:hypothetical protein
MTEESPTGFRIGERLITLFLKNLSKTVVSGAVAIVILGSEVSAFLALRKPKTPESLLFLSGASGLALNY